MDKFPIDAPKERVLRALNSLGFEVVREKEHIALSRANPDGTRTPMTLPNHRLIKASTLRFACSQAAISRQEFLAAYERT